MATLTDQQWIELDGVGTRADTFRFDVVNPDRSYQGTLDVSAAQSPTIEMDTSRETKRTLSGLTVFNPPSDLSLRTSRVRPVLQLPSGVDYPLGVFAFGTDAKNRFSFGDIWTPELFDETFLFNDTLPKTRTVVIGGSILAMFTAIAAEVLEQLGVPIAYSVTDVTAAAPIVLQIGMTRSEALTTLGTALGALPHYFANDGTHTLRSPDPAGSAPTHIYEAGGRIIDGSVTLTDSGYKTPNQYIVTAEASTTPIRGVWNLPDSAPNSHAMIGYYIPAPIHRVPGVGTVKLATDIAHLDSLIDKTTYRTATFSAAADPRHDVYQSVQLLGAQYLERGWRLSCVSGGPHEHSLTGTWT